MPLSFLRKASLALTLCMTLILPGMAAAEQTGKMTEYGKLTGYTRLYYYTSRDKQNESFDSNIKESLALGGGLVYESPWFKDIIGFGVGGYATTPLGVFDQKNRGGTGLLDSDNDGFAVLGQAYAKARYMDTVFKAYRQEINTPMVNANDSRMIPFLFEAYTLQSSIVEDFEFTLGWVDKIKKRDTTVFKSMTEVTGNTGVQDRKDGVLMAGIKWQPQDWFMVEGWNYNSPDYINMAYANLNISHKISDDLEVHGNLVGLDQRSVGDQYGGDFNAGEFGILAGAVWKGFGLDVGYTIVDDSSDIISPWGGLPIFTSIMISDNDYAGQQTFYLSASYDFSEIGWNGLTAQGIATFGQTPDTGRNASPDQNEYDAIVSYAFDGELQGLSLATKFAYLDQDDSMGGTDNIQGRLIIQYEFDVLGDLMKR